MGRDTDWVTIGFGMSCLFAPNFAMAALPGPLGGHRTRAKQMRVMSLRYLKQFAVFFSSETDRTASVWVVDGNLSFNWR